MHKNIYGAVHYILTNWKIKMNIVTLKGSIYEESI